MPREDFGAQGDVRHQLFERGEGVIVEANAGGQEQIDKGAFVYGAPCRLLVGGVVEEGTALLTSPETGAQLREQNGPGVVSGAFQIGGVPRKKLLDGGRARALGVDGGVLACAPPTPRAWPHDGKARA